jgi:hypothetical protein
MSPVPRRAPMRSTGPLPRRWERPKKPRSERHQVSAPT